MFGGCRSTYINITVIVISPFFYNIYAREPPFIYTRDARYTQKTGFSGLNTTRIFPEEKISENK